MNKETTRSSNIELLRLVLMFMIVLLHVVRSELHNNLEHVGLFVSEQFVSSMCIVGVNCFVFISGYFGIKFKASTLVSLVIQGLFYSISILLVAILVGEPLKNTDYYKALLPISSSLTYGTWWFLTTYICLIFAAPLLNKAIEHFEKKELTIILLGMLVLNCFSSFVFQSPYISNDGYSIYNFMTIYLLARYINKYKISIKKPFLVYLIPSLFVFGITIIYYLVLDQTLDKVTHYNNPLLIAAAVGLFWTFKNIEIPSNQIINKLAPLSFGIYLIHNHYLVRRMFFEKAIQNITQSNIDNYAVIMGWLILFSILVFVVCMGIEKIRQLICTPIQNRIEQRIGKYNLNIS